MLGHLGYGTRKEIKQYAKQGMIAVNGETVKNSSVKVDVEKDVVTFVGEEVHYREFVYILLNKPAGVISATEDYVERTVIDLLDDELRHFEPFPVGRLDKDTVGFLLLTNDGQLAHRLLTPKNDVPKTYFARIDKAVTAADVEAFKEGVTLDDGYETKPAKLELTDHPDEIFVTITEGKFHQVKRMFRAVEKEVIYLKRCSMGPLELDEHLREGEYRELTEEEVEALQNYR